MTTTGELRAIIEDLELVDDGDAASYLGEEDMVVDESLASEQATVMFVNEVEALVKNDCFACQAS